MQDPIWFFPLLLVGIIWDLFFRGWAMWRAARNSQKVWFVFLLIMNTLGILPIIYLKFFQKKNENG